ncbi:alpha/beta fold hydrolase [Kaarinaea lacus]
MADVLEQYLTIHPYENITFIGYSGGGALAMLLAERFARTQAVVTIAANLDIDAWAASHSYSTLQGSLNPALRPPLVDSIKQIHFAGAKDDNVNPAVIASVARQQKVSTLVIYDDFDHICCWVEHWREILYSHNIQ